MITRDWRPTGRSIDPVSGDDAVQASPNENAPGISPWGVYRTEAPDPWSSVTNRVTRSPTPISPVAQRTGTASASISALRRYIMSTPVSLLSAAGTSAFTSGTGLRENEGTVPNGSVALNRGLPTLKRMPTTSSV